MIKITKSIETINIEHIKVEWEHFKFEAKKDTWVSICPFCQEIVIKGGHNRYDEYQYVCRWTFPHLYTCSFLCDYCYLKTHAEVK